MTFEEWFDNDCKSGNADKRSRVSIKEYAREIWDATTEEVKKDHFKIGEEVEALGVDGGPAGYVKVCVIAKRADYTHLFINDPQRVRRIPSWEPKDGEAVLWRDATGIACLGLYSDGSIYTSEGSWPAIIPMKPPRASAIGKPWDEV